MTKQNKTTTKKTATPKKAVASKKTTTKKSTVTSHPSIKKAATKMCVAETTALNDAKGQITAMITGEDLRTAILIVSVMINLFFLIAWVALRITDVYDAEIVSFLFDRTIAR